MGRSGATATDISGMSRSACSVPCKKSRRVPSSILGIFFTNRRPSGKNAARNGRVYFHNRDSAECNMILLAYEFAVCCCVQELLKVCRIIYGHFDHPAFSIWIGIDQFG